MVGEQGSGSIKELTAWLEADDAKSRAMRAKRLRDLLDILPVPSEELLFLGGEESMICLDQVRHCYLNGSNMAVVLLCLAYIERELAARLYMVGWEDAKNARLGAVLEKAYGDGELSEIEWRTYRELARLRNSYAHFRGPMKTVSRTVKENAPVTEILAKDARRAIQAMARIVKYQSGMGLPRVYRGG